MSVHYIFTYIYTTHRHTHTRLSLLPGTRTRSRFFFSVLHFRLFSSSIFFEFFSGDFFSYVHIFWCVYIELVNLILSLCTHSLSPSCSHLHAGFWSRKFSLHEVNELDLNMWPFVFSLKIVGVCIFFIRLFTVLTTHPVAHIFFSVNVYSTVYI